VTDLADLRFVGASSSMTFRCVGDQPTAVSHATIELAGDRLELRKPP